VSQDLRPERVYDASPEGEIAGGGPSILDGLGRVVDARVTGGRP
jgi:hypothetical protein